MTSKIILTCPFPQYAEAGYYYKKRYGGKLWKFKKISIKQAFLKVFKIIALFSAFFKI